MIADKVFMPFPQPQREAMFLQRRQRFLAQMQFSDGTDEVAYFANSGSMAGCLFPGSGALLWESNDLKRKLRYTLRAIELNGIWIGTDTHLSNRIIEEALKQQLIPGMSSYNNIARERLIESGFRVGFLLAGENGDCILEVKSSTAGENALSAIQTAWFQEE
ncbi:DNA/RNA nuclease SfsA [Janthinobacterium sp. PAMC25594]|nr:DNA/RNA nuclease SfsA [Janthinobacterium sp. PAMC25594]